ncbi:hypothetical protein CDAR_444181 [Caerostris darwini]|uniref:Secreted protein n=1 Tax=Caerostris darwini TaxID=1538125 RepID=A0AAV4X7R4_9ARAC|nr:hypothetical protein CDAR_444181 [Caerostris darwini]
MFFVMRMLTTLTLTSVKSNPECKEKPSAVLDLASIPCCGMTVPILAREISARKSKITDCGEEVNLLTPPPYVEYLYTYLCGFFLPPYRITRC